MTQNADTTTPDWRDVLARDDEDTFRSVVTPYMDDLIAAARSDLGYYIKQGHLQQGDFSPEEVVGETLIYAWTHRENRPEAMDLRDWLLGIQYRVLRRLTTRQQEYRADKAVSLDATIPPQPETYAEEHWFAEWYRPDEGGLTYEEITPSAIPTDYEVDLREDVQRADLTPESYHVLMLHDEFEMALPDVASVLNRSVREVAEVLNEARTTLHDYLSEPPVTEADHPAPPHEDEQASNE